MEALHTIARIQSDFSTKFGIPRQSNVVQGLEATIVFEEAYRSPEALRGLEDFSHIWLLWGFSEVQQQNWSPTVRPPRLGGNTRLGVFATRSPYRPNPIGLSSVKLRAIEHHPQHGPVIQVLGADLMDGTPIYDIKPYLPYVDSHPDASGGFAGTPPPAALQVEVAAELLARLPETKRQVLLQVLALDPRPPYQHDPTRIYGMEFAGFEVKFSVEGNKLLVHQLDRK